MLASFFCLAQSCRASSFDMTAFGAMGGFSNPANLGPSKTVKASATAYNLAFNNAIPAYSFYTDLSGPRFGGTNAFARQISNYEVNFGLNNFGFCYNLVAQKDYSATGDTVRVMQDYRNNTHMTGRIYEVGINGGEEKKEYYRLYLATPVETGFLKSLNLGASINLIQGLYYNNGTLTGRASQENPTTANFIFNVDDRFSDGSTRGSGFGLDLGASGDINDRLNFELLLENVVGRLSWENMTHITATGNSQNIITDPNGNIINKPTITGTEVKETYTQCLNFRSIWALRYKLDNDLAVVGVLEPYTTLAYCYLGAVWAPGGLFALSAGYASKYEAVSLGVENDFLKARIFSNDASLVSARSLGWSLSFSI